MKVQKQEKRENSDQKAKRKDAEENVKEDKFQNTAKPKNARKVFASRLQRKKKKCNAKTTKVRKTRM